MENDIKLIKLIGSPDMALNSVLEATTVGNGASKIGINDAGDYYSSTTVEGALQEVEEDIATVQTNVDNLTASDIAFSDTLEYFTTDNVQAVMDELINGFLGILETLETKVDIAGDTMTGPLEVVGLNNTSSLTVKTKEVTTTYAIQSDDYVVVGNKATDFTITLPSGLVGTTYIIKNIGAGTITVDGNSTETIDGELTQKLYQYESITVVCYEVGKWVIV